jgi:hypothetical protein
MLKRKDMKEKKSKRTTPERDYKTLFYQKLTDTHLFYDVGKIIASELEPSELIQKIMSSIGKAITFEDASVYMVKKDLTGMEPIFFQPFTSQARMMESISFDNGAPGEIATSGEPIFLDDTALFGSFLHHPEEKRDSGAISAYRSRMRTVSSGSWVSAIASCPHSRSRNSTSSGRSPI